MNHTHYKTVCKYCDTVYAQCRCPAPDKTVVQGTCPKCLNTPLGDLIEKKKG